MKVLSNRYRYAVNATIKNLGKDGYPPVDCRPLTDYCLALMRCAICTGTCHFTEELNCKLDMNQATVGRFRRPLEICLLAEPSAPLLIKSITV